MFLVIALVGLVLGRSQDSSWSLRYLNVRIVLPAAGHSLHGITSLQLHGSNSDDLVLDLSDSMHVDSVAVLDRDGLRTLATTRTPMQLHIAAAGLAGCVRADTRGTCDITVWYHGTPSPRAIAFSDHGDVTRVASYGLPMSAREWWPTLDTPAQKADSADISVTAARPLSVVSNGRLVDRAINADGSVTTRWSVRYPIYSDVVSFAAADYVTQHDSFPSANGMVPLMYYVFPEDSGKARSDFRFVPRLMAYYQDRLGAYPFAREKFGLAEFARQSFREHQTITSIGPAFITGAGDGEEVIAHEAAHQWFGNSVTVPAWRDIWLNESFSEFMAWEWMRHAHGDSVYAPLRIAGRGADSAGVIANADQRGMQSMFGPLTFAKGPFVLAMLQDQIGEPAMTRALRSYIAGAAYGHGSTAAFQRAAESVRGGGSLQWFFDQWINRGDVPILRMQWKPAGARTIAVTVDQLQGGDPFRLPLAIVVADSAGRTVTRNAWSAGRRSEIRITVPWRATMVRIDTTRILARMVP